MTGRRKGWLVVATIFTLVNIGGGPFAFAGGEWLHGATHVFLVIPGVYWMWWLTSRSRQLVRQPEDERIERLQQSVDAIALEMERIGEGQRFASKLVAERLKSRER